jgi:hypothetical protein
VVIRVADEIEDLLAERVKHRPHLVESEVRHQHGQGTDGLAGLDKNAN